MADKRITSRTKVYMTRIGVRDWLVAASSQKAALKAWDVHRNLFSTGEARETNDATLVALAMKTPGIPVPAPGRVTVPEERAAPSNVVRLATARPAKPVAAPARPADTSRLDAAERELRDFERDAARARAEIERRKRSIETELEAFDAASERKRIALVKRIKREQDSLKD